MAQIFSLFFLYAGCMAMEYLDFGNSAASIVSMLVVIIFASFYILYAEKGWKYFDFLIPVFIFLACPVPPLRLFLAIPLLIARSKKRYWYDLAALIPYGLYCVEHSLAQDAVLLGLLIAACLLNYLLLSLSEAKEQLILLRDEAREQQLVVEEKNRELLESQDTSIHLATLQERNRIAREIHDNVGHMLTRSILQTGAIKTINKDTNLAPLLDGLHDTLNIAMNNIRESVHDLHDESIDLQASILDILAAASGFETSLFMEPDVQVPKKLKYGFLSIIKEAVNNSIKHSNGTQITVLLREHPGFYQLVIEDNGKNPEVHQDNGIGLSNIRDRVKEMGGTLNIHSGDGFKLFISVIKK